MSGERIIGTVNAGNTPAYEVVRVGDKVVVRHADEPEKCVRLFPQLIPILIEILQDAYQQTKNL